MSDWISGIIFVIVFFGGAIAISFAWSYWKNRNAKPDKILDKITIGNVDNLVFICCEGIEHSAEDGVAITQCRLSSYDNYSRLLAREVTVVQVALLGQLDGMVICHDVDRGLHLRESRSLREIARGNQVAERFPALSDHLDEAACARLRKLSPELMNALDAKNK